MEDKLAFLEEPQTEAPIAEPVQPEPVAEEPKAEPSRDEHGRFAPKAEPEAPKAEQPMVPLAALHETRDKLRDMEAKLSAMEKPQEAPQMPDVFEDPQGFAAYQQQMLQQALYQQRLDMSHRFAMQQHGKESVEAAMKWGEQRCASDPAFNQMVMSNPDPVGFAIEQYQRDQIASQVSMDDYKQFQAWKAAQAAAAQPQPTAAAPVPPAPVSIASIPSSGGVTHVPTGPGQAFDSVFNR